MKNTKIISLYLSIASLAFYGIVYLLFFIVSEKRVFEEMADCYLWIMLFVLPVSLPTFIFGVVFIKKGVAPSLAIVVGAFCSIYSFASGVSSFTKDVHFSNSLLTTASETTHISFPKKVKIMSKKNLCYVRFLDYKEEQLFAENLDESKWVKELPYASKGLLSYSLIEKTKNYDYCCLFDCDNEVFNPSIVTEQSDNIIVLAYKKSLHKLLICVLTIQ